MSLPPLLIPPHAFPVVIAGVLMMLAFSLTWVIQRRTGNAGEVDAVWSWSLGGTGAVYALTAQGDASGRLVMGGLALIWGVRLGTYLWIRNHGKPEDGRYARLRAEWGPRANFNMYWFFQFQVLMALLLSVGFWVVATRPLPVANWQIALAVLIWLVSVLGESLADRQLHRHRENPANRGKVCRQGLWRYSRHPNYFFECLHWLSYVPLAVGAPWWGLSLLPPLIMAWLLLKMSGLPVTEAQAAASRPDYADYIATTSAFIPWPPKAASPNRTDKSMT